MGGEGRSRVPSIRKEYEYAKYSNGTVNGSIIIPTEYSGLDSTTYIYPGTQIPQNESEHGCGPRCMWMWAWKSQSTLPAIRARTGHCINARSRSARSRMPRGISKRYRMGWPGWRLRRSGCRVDPPIHLRIITRRLGGCISSTPGGKTTLVLVS